MSIVYLLTMIAALGLVIGWYLVNETAGTDGDKGILATISETTETDPETGGRHYRIRQRGAPKKRSLHHEGESELGFKPANRTTRYTDRTDAAYVDRKTPWRRRISDIAED